MEVSLVFDRHGVHFYLEGLGEDVNILVSAGVGGSNVVFANSCIHVLYLFRSSTTCVADRPYIERAQRSAWTVQ